jgi:hypothetical protein
MYEGLQDAPVESGACFLDEKYEDSDSQQEQRYQGTDL